MPRNSLYRLAIDPDQEPDPDDYDEDEEDDEDDDDEEEEDDNGEKWYVGSSRPLCTQILAGA